jgi:protein gp37
MSTGIQWTDETWNPVTGCSKVSPGCAHCYAETLALTRLAGKTGYPGLPWTPENAEANVVLRPERLRKPLSWKEPRRVFVNSMSDLFHELVPPEYIDQVFAVMARAPQHTFQVLTKRPERMPGYLVGDGITRRPWIALAAQMNIDDRWPLPNVWLGTSIENDRFVGRADPLRETPAAVRFLSLEPLLGPLPSLDLTGIDWVIVGGESGPEHRPIRVEWVRDLRDRCNAAGVAFFFKQWGGRTPKSNGRTLDGRTWDENPA